MASHSSTSSLGSSTTSSSSYDQEEGQLEEGTAPPPPCSEIQVQVQLPVEETPPARCEKELFVSERHEMIAAVLQLPSADIAASEVVEDEEAVASADPVESEEKAPDDTKTLKAPTVADDTLEPGAFSVSGISVLELTTSDSEEEEEVDDDIIDLEEQGASVAVATPIEAEAVLQEEQQKAQLVREIREQIKKEAVRALECQVVSTSSTQKTTQCKVTKNTWCFALAAFTVLLVMGLGLGLGLNNNKTPEPSSEVQIYTDPSKQDVVFVGPHLSTLEQVRQRGYIRCGVTEFGFIHQHSNGTYTGFNIQQCRSMALAALGNPNLYRIVFCDHYTRFSFLANHTIDVVTGGTTHTLGRDVWVDAFQAGFSFTVPYFYSGLMFAGNDPAFVDCADAMDSFYGSCRNLKICVLDGSTHVDIMIDQIQGSALVPYNGTDALLEHLWQGTCNVAAGEPLYLVKVQELFLQGTSQDDQWKLGSTVVSKEPLATVTRHGDPQWSALANLVVQTFILAEAHNVTRETAQEMQILFPATYRNTYDNKDTLDLPSIMVSLVQEFGNYGDLYQEEIQQQIPRDNALNRPYGTNASTGLLYAVPFGNLLGAGPDPLFHGTLRAIYQRGYLRCGVQPSRGTGFVRRSTSDATNNESLWFGFDVELCRAVAAALFMGDKDRIEFVPLVEESSSKGKGTFLLSEGDVDVVAGARISLHEVFSGFAFSTPYYYQTKDAFALQTRHDDLQWSSFVDGIVLAILYAEEQGITSDIAGDMPVVTLFGEGLKQMFRDCVASVGSYAELYNNTLQEYVPRQGANRLNEGYAGPQMFPFAAA